MISREEWTRKLMTKLASGHSNKPTMDEAKSWLRGDPPPVEWVPRKERDE